jgi:polysaccharide biosynthesis protein PslH
LTSATPQLLMLGQSFPYPPHSGVTNRTFNILKQLSREYAITLVAFARVAHQPDADSRRKAQEQLSRFAHRVYPPVPIGADSSVTRKAWDNVRSVLSSRPYTDFEYSSGEFRRSLTDALQHCDPGIIHLDSLDLLHLLPGLPSRPVACTHHSIESELLRLQAARVGFPLLRKYVEYQADLVEKVERRLCPELAMNVMTSEVDAQRLQALAPESRTVVVPNGVDVEFFQPGPKQEEVDGRIVFVGPTYSFPNRDAVEFLLADVWPLLSGTRPRVTVDLVGDGAAVDLARYRSTMGVNALGYVPDIRPVLRHAQCCVVPIRVGGGTRLKILDAWAMGKAVISTSIGCEGLATRDGENILIRDEPVDFAAAIGQVLSDGALRTRLADAGRETAQRLYSWEVIGEHLRNTYRALVTSR